MKKLFATFSLFTALALVAAGCGNNAPASQQAAPAAKTVIKVGASAVPHAEILEVAKPLLAKDGVDLQIVEMTDYVRPNIALAEKELDANYFQHIPYLTKFSAERNLALTYTAKIHIEPMGLYSKKIKNINDIAPGSEIAIPNDPTNGGRALNLLAKAGVLKLKDGVGIGATVNDIAENPKNIKIRELEAPQLPRALDDVTVAAINTNYALQASLVPTKDALFIEQKDSPYVNVLTIRKGDESRPELQKLAKALNSEEVKKFIQEKFQGAVVPAF